MAGTGCAGAPPKQFLFKGHVPTFADDDLLEFPGVPRSAEPLTPSLTPYGVQRACNVSNVHMPLVFLFHTHTPNSPIHSIDSLPPFLVLRLARETFSIAVPCHCHGVVRFEFR